VSAGFGIELLTPADAIREDQDIENQSTYPLRLPRLMRRKGAEPVAPDDTIA